MNKHYFDKEVYINYEGDTYLAAISGYRYMNDWEEPETVVNKVELFDSNDDKLNTEHPDYHDVMEEAMAYEQEENYETEGLDVTSWDCLD